MLLAEELAGQCFGARAVVFHEGASSSNLVHVMIMTQLYVNMVIGWVCLFSQKDVSRFQWAENRFFGWLGHMEKLHHMMFKAA
jgi:hypothetical protein